MHPDATTASRAAKKQLPPDDDLTGTYPVPDGFAHIRPEGTEPKKGIYEMFQSRGPAEGITGLADFSTRSMYIAPRSLDHHNGLFWRIVDQKGYAPDPLWAWDWNTFPQYDEGEIIGTKGNAEVPHSGGGTYQAISRYEDEHGIDIHDISHGRYTEPADLFVIGWILKRLDVPGRTNIEFSHAHPNVPGESVSRSVFASDVYREMEFADTLPRPAIDRGLDLD